MDGWPDLAFWGIDGETDLLNSNSKKSYPNIKKKKKINDTLEVIHKGAQFSSRLITCVKTVDRGQVDRAACG